MLCAVERGGEEFPVILTEVGFCLDCGGRKWHLHSWPLHTQGPVGLEALDAGCGVCGDASATWVTLWHGPTVVWLPAAQAGLPASVPAQAGSHTFVASAGSAAGSEFITVLLARPLPEANSIAVLLGTKDIRLLRCQAGGWAQEVPVHLKVESLDAWPLGPRGLIVVSVAAQIYNVDLGNAGASLVGHLLAGAKGGEPPPALAGASASTMRLLPHSGSGQVEALVAAAGRRPSAETPGSPLAAAAAPVTLRLWLLRGQEVQAFDELVLGVASQGSGSAGTAAPAPVALAVTASGRSLAVLLADGAVLAAVLAGAGGWRWNTGLRLAPQRASGLRLCAAAGLEEAAVLAEEEAAEVHCGAAQKLQAWDDDTVSLIFAGVRDMKSPQSADLVTLELPNLCLVVEEPYRTLCEPNATSMCIVGCGAAGSHLVFACRDTTRGGLWLCVLTRRLEEVGERMLVKVPNEAAVQRFRTLLSASDLPHFVGQVLSFDPFAGCCGRAKDAAVPDTSLCCEQLKRLLELARRRLECVLQSIAVQVLPRDDDVEEVTGADGWNLDIGNLVLENSTSGEVAHTPPSLARPQAADETGGDGWDLDLGDIAPDETGEGKQAVRCAAGQSYHPDAARVEELRGLLRRTEMQLGRLELFTRAQHEASGGKACGGLKWRNFRETSLGSLTQLGRQMAAEQCVAVLEALLADHRTGLTQHWRFILDALPETAMVASMSKILPAPPWSKAETVLRPEDGVVSWYLERVACVVDRTGLIGHAVDLLRYAIHAMTGGSWPAGCEGNDATSAAPCVARDLPAVLPATLRSQPEVRQLYGMFRLCMEYSKYCRSAVEDIYDSSIVAEEPVRRLEVLSFAAFSALEAGARAQLALRHVAPGTVAAAVREWALHVSVEHCGLDTVDEVAAAAVATSPLAEAADGASRQPVEEAIIQAVIGRVNSSGWDPTSFRMVVEVVAASSPMLPSTDRIIRSSSTMLEFILGALYSDDQRCRATDIFQSADEMYGYIPQKDAGISLQGEDAERWQVLQQQADELERHLNCVQVLIKYNIGLSLSFADLRRGCTNEPIALRYLWNLFRVLGAKYRPALFWRGFREEFLYLHKHAFAAVSAHTVLEMYVQVLVKQEHFDVLSASVSDWAASSGAFEVAGSLVKIAQELVNASPALRHADLEKARRVLRCVPQIDGELSGLAQAELDFIKACELLHDLVRRQPPRGLAHRWAEMTPGSAAGSPGIGAAWADGFRCDSPIQLRLQLHRPLDVIADLLQFNPPVLLESEDLHTFCALLGLAPSSLQWAEVMAMCGAANLLCGMRGEALSVTEKLLANAHPAAWKLAAALASSSESDAGMGSISTTIAPVQGADVSLDLLADAAKVCPVNELPTLLQAFNQGALGARLAPSEPPQYGTGIGPSGRGAPGCGSGQSAQDTTTKGERCRYRNGRQPSSLSLAAKLALGLGTFGREAPCTGASEAMWPPAAGVSPSALALRAARHVVATSGRGGPDAVGSLAVLVPWLVPTDALQLLEEVVNDPVAQLPWQLEVRRLLLSTCSVRDPAHVSTAWLPLRTALHQAKALALLRAALVAAAPQRCRVGGTGSQEAPAANSSPEPREQLPPAVRIDATVAPEAAYAAWLQALAASSPEASPLPRDFVRVAEALLLQQAASMNSGQS